MADPLELEAGSPPRCVAPAFLGAVLIAVMGAMLLTLAGRVDRTEARARRAELRHAQVCSGLRSVLMTPMAAGDVTGAARAVATVVAAGGACAYIPESARRALDAEERARAAGDVLEALNQAQERGWP